MRIAGAIEQLQESPKWKDKVTFEVVAPAEKDKRDAATARHGWKFMHGLEFLHGDRVLGHLDGHAYARSVEAARAEIEALLGKHIS